MRKLLNTLFVTSEDANLRLDGENVVVNRDKQEVTRFPLHNLSGIISFSYLGNHDQTKIEHFGCKPSYEAEGTLIV